MSENTSKSFDITTWAKGTRGQVLPHATQEPRIRDMQIYTTGILGPRPLWSPVEVLTPNAGDVPSSSVAPLIVPCQLTGTVDSPQGFLVVWTEAANCTVEFWELDSFNRVTESYSATSLIRSTGTISRGVSGDLVLPRDMWHTRVASDAWLIHDQIVQAREVSPFNAGNYEINMINAGTALNTAFGSGGAFYCAGSAVHAGRAFYWGKLAPSPTAIDYALNRVYYSDAYEALSDLGTFTDAGVQYFDLDGDVGGAMSVGPNLLLWTKNGTWYLLQGRGNPALGTLSRLGPGPVPPSRNEGAQLLQPTVIDNMLFFQASGSNSIVTVSSAGQMDDISMSHLSDPLSNDYIPTSGLGQRIAGSSIHNAASSPGVGADEPGYTMRNNIWFEESLSSVWTGTADTWSQTHRFYHDQVASEMLVIPVGQTPQTGNDEPGLYARRIYLDEPSPEVADANFHFLETYDEVTGLVTLPRISDPTKQVRVTRVIVDGVFFDSADGIAHNLDVTVDCPRNTTSFTITEGPDTLAATLAETAGAVTTQAFRAVYTPEDVLKHESWYDVTLQNIKMLGIERVTVEYEISNARIH